MTAYASTPYDENGFKFDCTISIWSEDDFLMDVFDLTAEEIHETRFAELFPLLGQLCQK